MTRSCPLPVIFFSLALIRPPAAVGQIPQQPLQVEGRVDGIFARTGGVDGDCLDSARVELVLERAPHLEIAADAHEE